MPTYEDSNVQQHVNKDLIPVYCRDCGEDGFIKPFDGKLFGIEVKWESDEQKEKYAERLRRGWKCRSCTWLTI